MPFQSQAQAGWAFATGQPFAKRWARQTGPYTRLPYKKRLKATPPTVADLEAYVSSPAYTPEGASALATQIPMLREKATGAPGEHIAPGITRIHGNLCNVHGKYGPCDTALSGKTPPAKGRKLRKPRAPKKPVLTPAQARDAAHAQNQAATLAKLNISPDGQAALQALRRGEMADPKAIAAGGFEQAGLVERADDGSYHLTPSGRAALSAAASGDVGRTGDTISGARDRMNARQARVQAAQARTRAQRQQQIQAARDARLRKRSTGNKNAPITGQAAAKSFTVFKDAGGQHRWVAFSSTAYRDRDGEIISTKALADDCDYADAAGVYGPLRYWHTPGIDLGDCDFNAMHGRVLIESGTFRSPQIAEKVAQAAPDLELSIGFLHTADEPDAQGVFHAIRRFERSLVPRGKASNRFTAFTVKESPMATFEERWESAQKQFGFTDEEMRKIKGGAVQTQKAADASGVAFKAAEPDASEPPDLVINGVTYKAFPPKAAAADAAPVEGSPAEEAAETPAEEATEPDAGMDDAGGLTLSPEDIAAIGQVVGSQLQQAVGQIMSGLDLEKKVAGHVQTMMQPFQQAQTTKDASDAEKAEQITALQTSLKETQGKLDELLGIQPAVVPTRPSETQPMNPWNPQDVALIERVKNQLTPQQSGFSDLTQNLFGPTIPATS